MPLPGIRAAKSLLDEMQRDLLEIEDQDFDRFFDRWMAAGLPEMDDYRGERHRSRGELLSEINRMERAIEKRPEILREEQAGETPIMTGLRRVTRGAEVMQEMMGSAPQFAGKGNVSALKRSAPAIATDLAAVVLPRTAASSIALPGGATAYRPFVQQPTTLPNVSGGLVRALPRIAGGFGAGLSVMLTPWNDQGDYFHFGEDGQSRFFVAPGDLYGVIETRDPATNEWRRTDYVGGIAYGLGDDEPTIVTGTREQVGRAIAQFRPPNSPSPQEALIPPTVPEMTEPEIFPADKRGPQIEIFPPQPQEPDIGIFPIPEVPQAQAEVFLALSDEVIRELIRPLEAHRGDAYTRRGNDIVVQKTYGLLRRWFPDIIVKEKFDHTAGATVDGNGANEIKERFVRDEVTKRYSIPDIIIKDIDADRLIALNTGKALKDGRTLIADERRQLERLRTNLGQTGVGGGVPKLRPGMDEAAYADKVEELLTEFFTDYFGGPPGR